MAILVQFTDNTYDFVLNKDLDNLIATNSIVAFRRSSGWVDISKDPIRREITSKRYLGRERRSQNNLAAVELGSFLNGESINHAHSSRLRVTGE